jgi:hypothetical protein
VPQGVTIEGVTTIDVLLVCCWGVCRFAGTRFSSFCCATLRWVGGCAHELRSVNLLLLQDELVLLISNYWQGTRAGKI